MCVRGRVRSQRERGVKSQFFQGMLHGGDKDLIAQPNLLCPQNYSRESHKNTNTLLRAEEVSGRYRVGGRYWRHCARPLMQT